MNPKTVICKNCDIRTVLNRHKKGFICTQHLTLLKEQGWIVNLDNTKKSVCPECNLIETTEKAGAIE